MIRRIQQLPQRQRVIIFVVFIIAGLLLIALVAGGLLVLSLNVGRDQSVALADGVTAREFAVLPDDDAYPKAVAVGSDGRVYSGSYVTGTIWSITAEGSVGEIPGTREAIGAVSGLAVGSDGALYIVDQVDANLATFGGDVKRLSPDGQISVLATIDDERGFLLPDDIALDADGNIYVSDRGREEVWRFAPDGSGGLAWWTPPETEGKTRPAPTGLAYDASHDALLITDSNLNRLYRVAVSSGETELLYDHGSRDYVPGFDGVTVAPDGTIYIAALSQNGLVRLDGDTLTYLAGVFRGISDVTYFQGRIYATNFDSFSLVIPLVRPRLPFALDVIEGDGLKPASGE